MSKVFIHIIHIATLVFCIYNSVRSQDFVYGEKEIIFEKIGSSEGLRPGFITNVARDTTGFLWIGTSNNIQRYDGYNFVALNEFIDSTNFKPQNTWIRFIDGNNNLWIKDSKTSAQVYHQASSRIINLDLPANTNVILDEYKNLWSYHNKQWYFLKASDIPSEVDRLESLDFKESWTPVEKAFSQLEDFPFDTQIAVKANTLAWMHNNTLFAYTLDYAAMKSTPLYRLKIPVTGNDKKENYSLLIDVKSDRIYIITTESLQIVDRSLQNENLKVLKFPRDMGPVWPELIDPGGRIWMGSRNHGLLWIDPSEKVIYKIKYKSAGTIGSLPFEYSRRYVLDKDNIVWMPTSSYGIIKHRLETGKFKLAKDTALPLSMPTLLTHPKDGVVLPIEGIYRIDREENEFENMVDIYDHLPVQYSINFLKMKLDDLGNYYLSGSITEKRTRYYLKFDKDKQLLNSSLANTHPLWFMDNYICHEEDDYWKYDGRFSVARMNAKHEIQEQHWLQGGIPDNLALNYYSNIDQFYFGFATGRLISFDRSSNDFNEFQLLDKTHRIDSTMTLNVIQKDTSDAGAYLWVGTSNGLFRINQQSAEIKRFGIQEGFSNTYIYGILTDRKHNIWVSTNYGLYHLDSTGEIIKLYTVDDGLQADEFNRGSFAKDSAGHLYFGGIGGLTHFNPEDFYNPEQDSRIVFSSYALNNHTHQLNPSYVNQKEVLKLPFKDNYLRLNFTVLDLNSPKTNSYKLKFSKDNKWIDIGHKSHFEFLGLNPGKYSVEIKGTNSLAVETKNTAEFQFAILAPWYMTAWFRAFVLTALIIAAFLALQFRNRQKLNLMSLRNRIARDLHDEIGSTLSSISLFGTVAMRSLKDRDKMKNLLDLINNSAQNATESINDIIWVINSKNDKAFHMLNRMRAYASEIMESEEYMINFNVDENLHEQELDMIQRKNIYFIFKEAVNNAIKYSGKKVIDITLSIENKFLKLEVRDKGVGFNIENAAVSNSLGGNGLNNMKRRAEEIDAKLIIESSANKGTHIILYSTLGL